MSLPPALQARLKKRGIIKGSTKEPVDDIGSAWKEVPDIKSGYYYWWNTVSGQASWLPPTGKGNSVSFSKQESTNQARGKAAPYSKTRDRVNKRDFKKKKDDLDPMDPSSYADVPRGDWISGLHDEGNARTGVDTTASGPLFQKRPYPSPGAVLKMNAAKKDADAPVLGPQK
eukprot:m.169799 g.169799  ORF g.169799 m.169799 type:complete len:172 (+) comp39016_c0_seq35:104-619(+)